MKIFPYFRIFMDNFFILLQKITPQHLLSRLVGAIANCRWKWIKNTFIQRFIQHYHVDMAIAEQSNPKNYACFNDFFIRKLKPEARPIPTDAQIILSPADGKISQFGKIEHDAIFQAKGHNYQLEALLGNNTHTNNFINGQFMTIYLSPKDYHRVHLPITGTLKEMTYIPGKLFSVNPISTDKIPNLFAKNERIVCYFDTEIGEIAVIMVGAMIVASINTSWAGQITPSRHNTIQTWTYPNDENKITLQRGEEMGYFNLGSTVIMLFPSDTTIWEPSLQNNQALLMGTTIGHLNFKKQG